MSKFTDNYVAELVIDGVQRKLVGRSEEDTSHYAKTNEQNTFEEPNVHKEHEQFDKGLSSDEDINITNSVLKVLDNTLVDGIQKDIVTQYSADEIVKEVGQGKEKQTYNYTFPDASGEFALKNDIAYLTYEPYIELTPNTATNGNLSEEVFNILTEHDEIGIKLNGEYYNIADDQTTTGIRSYTHSGWNGNSKEDKSINITLSTKAWTLVVGKNKHYNHYIHLQIDGNGYYYNFNSTQKDKYTTVTLPAMPDSAMAIFVLIANGYYSNVNGMIYKSADGTLKAIMHGMYTDNGTSFNYLNISGKEVTLISDDVVEDVA